MIRQMRKKTRKRRAFGLNVGLSIQIHSVNGRNMSMAGISAVGCGVRAIAIKSTLL